MSSTRFKNANVSSPARSGRGSFRGPSSNRRIALSVPRPVSLTSPSTVRGTVSRDCDVPPASSTSVRVAALYDVHGNLPALEAVLAEVEAERVDTILVGGDVAAGPMPAETLGRLRALGAWFIRGN